MLAGDFTTVASPACNGGRQIALRGGFVNNRVDPAQFSPAALNMVKFLPTTTDPCGEVHLFAAEGQQRVAVPRPDRLPADRRRHDLRPLHGDPGQHSESGAGGRQRAVAVRRREQRRPPGHGRPVPFAGARRHARVRPQHRELAAVRVQPVGRQPLRARHVRSVRPRLRRVQLCARTSCGRACRGRSRSRIRATAGS